LIVTTVAPLELREASKLHTPRIHARRRCDKRRMALKRGRLAC
jgi:hypothetical protein